MTLPPPHHLVEDPATPSQAVDGDEIARESLRQWARTVLGAPRRLDKMATLARQEVEDFIRVATEIHRRDVREQRAPAPRNAERRPAAPMFFDLRTIDPWSISAEDLRRSTERIDTCAVCRGSGSSACAACVGTGKARCSTCNGQGRLADTGAACPFCGGSGAIGCAVCGARAMIPCSGCSGSGLETVCLTYTQESRLDVQLTPENAVAKLYPQLAEQKILTRTDLAPFIVHAAVLASGPIASGVLAYDEYERLLTHRPRTDSRLERVSQQQYVRFGAVRRELVYEMAGVRGKIVLAGARCAVELTEDSLKPIRVRLAAWAGGGAFGALLMIIMYFAVRGPTAYFRATNAVLAIFFLLATAALVGGIGAGLRMLGTRLRVQKPFPLELAYPAVLAFSIVVIIATKGTGRPSAQEAHAVIASGNAARAAVVIDALDATGADPGEVSALRDDLALLEAQKLSGDERLARLDELASQGGTRAADAAKLARDERLARVRALLDAKKLADALDLADHIFVGADRELPEVQEVRAAVFESEYAQCGADVCRYLAAKKAERANTTPERAARTRDLRMKLMDSLAIVDRPMESTLARLQRARLLEATAQSILGLVGDDGELRERTRAAQAWAQTTRGAVPLLGADRAVIEELLGKLEEADGKLRIVIEEVAVYVSIDKKRGACDGIYIVGDSKDTRQQGLKSEHLLSILLSKAIGRTGQVKKPALQTASSKELPTQTSWTEASVPVVARWRDGVFAELRIGDANPGGAAVPARPIAPGKAPLVTFTAFPGGQIVVDNVVVARDATGPLRLKPGKHEVRVKNRFLGENVHPVEVKDNQNDNVVIVW